MEGQTAETKEKKTMFPFLSLLLCSLVRLWNSAKYFSANNHLAPGQTSAFRAQRTGSCFTCHAINHPPSHVTSASLFFSLFLFFPSSHIPNVTHSFANLGTAALGPHSTSPFCRRRRRRLSAALSQLIAALGRVEPSLMWSWNVPRWTCRELDAI